jgi:predicted Ser/Thr protein kinase
MLVFNDSPRTRVRFRSDGNITKQFRGATARERFANEVRVLRFLESKLCPFVPRLIHAVPDRLEIDITHCGAAIQHLSPRKLAEIFSSLEAYGVRHEDQAMRHVTYLASDGRFCVIDFELASIIDETNPLPATTLRIEKTMDDIEQMMNS